MRLALLVDPDPAFRAAARAVLEHGAADDVVESAMLTDVPDGIGETVPDLVVLGPGTGLDAALAFVAPWTAAHPSSSVVVVALDVTTEALRRAMRAGAHDLIPGDQPWGDIAAAIRSAADSVTERVGARGGGDGARPHGRTITVFSTKGGVGKSVIACNLAVSLASMGAEVVLVDLDLQFGDTGIMLDLKPERTISDAVQVYDRLDAEMLRGFLVTHDSGLRVLLAPVKPEDADAVTASRVASILGMAAEIADIVVVDTAASFDDVVLAAIDASDRIFAVATMDVASIKNTRVSLQKLTQLGYDSGRTQLVLNRADSKVWLDVGEVEHSIDASTVARVPSDRLVPRSVNRGVPVVLDSPRSAVARSLTALAQRVMDGIGVSGDVA